MVAHGTAGVDEPGRNWSLGERFGRRRVSNRASAVPGKVVKASSSVQSGGDGGNMLSLEARGIQFVVAGLSLTGRAGYGGGSVRGTAGDFVIAHLSLERIGQAYDYETVVQQRDVKGKDGGFLPPVLGGSTREHAAHFAHQGTL